MKQSKQQAVMEKGRPKLLPIFLGITIILAGLIFGSVYLYQKGYYNDRWYEHTKINDVDVSGQTLKESKKMLLDKMGNYALTIKGRENGFLTINGEEISFLFSLTNDFDKLFEQQHEHFSLFPGQDNFSARCDISYDEKKLLKILKKSDLKKGSMSYPIVKPKSAKVKFSKKKDKFICTKEVEGNKLVFKNFFAAVKETIEAGEINLDITDTEKYPDMYRRPRITSDDPQLKEKKRALNYAALRYVIWNMGKGVTEQITLAKLAKWCSYENGTVTFNDQKISDWVEAFCKKYKTTDKKRLVKMHDNRLVLVEPGDYGWQIDYERALAQARNAIYKNIKKSDIRAYLKEPSEENKKALTFRKKVPYFNTAFQKNIVSKTTPDVLSEDNTETETETTDDPEASSEEDSLEAPEDSAKDTDTTSYEDIAYDYDENNFTEVSLKEQMVYVIRDGKVAFSCRCISGRPTPERSTKPGAYFIKEHQVTRVLRGDDYETPVTNWVRITWTGTGFHSAKWQRWGSWSPTYYQTRGSHGCLNLSLEDSKTIYDLVKYREAVFIY